MDLISCNFFRRSVIGLSLINSSYQEKNLMDPISCDNSPEIRFKFLEANYWTYRTVFQILHTRIIFDGLDFIWLFSKVRFKYLGSK